MIRCEPEVGATLDKRRSFEHLPLVLHETSPTPNSRGVGVGTLQGVIFRNNEFHKICFVHFKQLLIFYFQFGKFIGHTMANNSPSAQRALVCGHTF